MCEFVENESFRIVVLSSLTSPIRNFSRAVNLAQQPHTTPTTCPYDAGIYVYSSAIEIPTRLQRETSPVALSSYGISAFVRMTHRTHDTWQREIEKGLETMEVMWLS